MSEGLKKLAVLRLLWAAKGHECGIHNASTAPILQTPQFRNKAAGRLPVPNPGILKYRKTRNPLLYINDIRNRWPIRVCIGRAARMQTALGERAGRGAKAF